MNISNIAQLAGVSRATVSRYFNEGYVSEEKREKIKEVIERTGYMPSMSAQSLRTKRSKLIGVITPKISSESISSIVNGLSAGLKEHEYHMLLGNTENDPAQELEFLKVFINNGVDGIILIATVITEQHKKALAALHIPVVLIGQKLDGYCCIFHDDYHAAKELAAVLLKSGVSCPGYIGVTEEDQAVGRERMRAFYNAVGEYGIRVNEKAVITGNFTFETGYEGMKRMMQQCPQVDGVFCVTDTIAIGAMEYLKECGRTIPDQTAVVGMGNSRMSSAVTPKLTTVKYYFEESGMEAAQILMALINNEDITEKQIVLGYEIIQRNTTFQLGT